MLIYIIRHGETNLNKSRVFQGRYDEPLNEEGIKLAKITGKKLKGINFDEAFSSPLSRAMETAKIILNESGNKHTKINIENRIIEVNVGDWTLKKMNDSNDLTSKNIRQFVNDPFSMIKVPNGENVYDCMKRTQNFLLELASRNDDKTYLVATHGFALRAMLNMFYENKNDFWQGNVPYNCCINIIEVKNGNISLIKKDLVLYENVKDFYNVKEK